MEVFVHRGSEEIGGTCVELRAGGTRVVVDLGMPLVHPDGTRCNSRELEDMPREELQQRGILPGVEGLYAWETPRVDGLLISHAHQDHYGFLKHVHPDVPVYMSAGTQKLIEITALIRGKENPLRNPRQFAWKSDFEVGAFRVTPHLVDHSAFDAFAFEIEAERKRLFYSGDFRGHGYIAEGAMGRLYRKVTAGVDALMMEGTMLGREEDAVQTEGELSQEATEVCKQTEGAVLIHQSGQNITRAVSFYKAAKRTGRWFVLDVYSAYVLSELAGLTGGGKLPYPGKPGFDNVRVWYPRFLTNRLFEKGHEDIPYRHQPHKMTKEEMAADLGKVMLFVRPGMERDLERLGDLSGSTLIYSLWDGYLEDKGTKDWLDAIRALGVTIKEIHTSGHADIPTLQEMVSKLAPEKLIPIHTFHADDYERLFSVPIAEPRGGPYVL